MRRAPAFWRSGGLPAALLAPVAAIWGAVALARMRRPPRARAAVPVIAVGNFTAGGAGKTPTVLALIDLARRAGRAPAVLSRGYGGRHPGPLRVDPAVHDAAAVGDEPLLLAAGAPTVVACDRPAGLPLVAASGADLLILDDGFQSCGLAVDLALVVVDRGQGLGNGRVLPAGPLRAPLAGQFDRADALVVVDAGEPDGPGTAAALAEAARRGLPVFTARLAPRVPESVAGRRLLAFAGIGRPEKFAATLAACGAEAVELAAFADHRPLDEADAERLLAAAAARGLDLVTTTKDAVRLDAAAGPACRRLRAATRVFAVDLVFDDAAAVTALLGERVAKRRTVRSD